MAVAAKSFGRRPRDQQGVTSPAASLGAVLELLRALNWFIRADVPWPTQRGKTFDFVAAGESGVFALWAHEGEPDGIEAAAAGLGDLLGGVRVRPVVCRESAALAPAHDDILYCTPETALDLLVGLPRYRDDAAMRVIVSDLRDLEVPLPPEPEPEPEPPVVTVEAPVEAPKVVKPPAVKVEPQPVLPEPVVPAKPPVVVQKRTEPKGARPTLPAPQAAPVAAPAAVAVPAPTPQPAVESEPPVVEPKAERPLPAGRHRQEKPRKARKVPPPPVEELPASTIELPTAIAPVRERTTSDNHAANRFDNNYVYVPEPSTGPGAVRRSFRPKLFIGGLVALLLIAAIAAVGVKEWPRINSWIHPDANPTTTFGQTLTLGTSEFHPALTLRANSPQAVAARTFTVRVTATNTGTGRWQVPGRASYVMTDSLGETYVATALNETPSLAPQQRWSAAVTFVLREDRTPTQFEFTIADGSSQKAIWKSAS